MIEIKRDDDYNGIVEIADDVIATIAGTAASEIEGVHSTGSTIANDFAGIISKRNFSRGVKVTLLEDASVSIDLNLVIKFGYKIQDICFEVQKRVKSAIETMTGLSVQDVNISISIVNFEKTKKHEEPVLN